MFTLANVREDKWNLENCTKGDAVSMALDCLIVAGLVSLVCVVVIGKIDIGLPGPVGTIDNPWIQAMIGGAAGFFVADVITGVVKWRAGASSRDWQQNELITKDKWIPALQPHMKGAKFAHGGLTLDTRAINYSALCFVIGAPIDKQMRADGTYTDPDNPVRAARIESAFQAISTEAPNLAARIPLAMMRGQLNPDNLGIVLGEWFGPTIPAIQMADFEAAKTWYQSMEKDDPGFPKVQWGGKNESGKVLEALALYVVVKKNLVGSHGAAIRQYFENYHPWYLVNSTEDTIKGYFRYLAFRLNWKTSNYDEMGLT